MPAGSTAVSRVCAVAREPGFGEFHSSCPDAPTGCACPCHHGGLDAGPSMGATAVAQALAGAIAVAALGLSVIGR